MTPTVKKLNRVPPGYLVSVCPACDGAYCSVESTEAGLVQHPALKLEIKLAFSCSCGHRWVFVTHLVQGAS